MLVIDSVVLLGSYQIHQVVRLGDKDSPVAHQRLDVLDHIMNAADMREHVCCGNKTGVTVLFDNLAHDRSGEVIVDHRYAERRSRLSSLRRFYSDDATAERAEWREQRAVICANVGDEVAIADAEQLFALQRKVLEILTQDARGAAQVGISVREQNARINLIADLHQE